MRCSDLRPTDVSNVVLEAALLGPLGDAIPLKFGGTLRQIQRGL